jgi:hypothetical protein
MVSVIAAAPLTTVTPANAANKEATTGTESAFVDFVAVVEAAVLVVAVVVVALFVFMVEDWKYRRCPAIIRRQQRDDDDVVIERAINMIVKEVVDGQRRCREKNKTIVGCILLFCGRKTCLFCLFILQYIVLIL